MVRRFFGENLDFVEILAIFGRWCQAGERGQYCNIHVTGTAFSRFFVG